jgi:recombination protein RecT
MANDKLVKHEPTKPASKKEYIEKKIEDITPAVKNALPRHIDPERLMRIAVNALTTDSQLMKCKLDSFLRAVVQSAILGLEPNTPLGEAYLIPYKGNVQLQPGYQGLMKLARNSGEIAGIEARVVYRDDEFDYELGLNPTLKHKQSTKEDRGDLVFAYCIIRFKDPDTVPYIEVMNGADINHVKKSSESAGSSYSAWNKHRAMMWRKSVIKRALKYVPRSIELARALDLSDRADIGEIQLFDETVTDALGGEEIEEKNEESPKPPEIQMSPGNPEDHQSVAGTLDKPEDEKTDPGPGQPTLGDDF